MALLLLLSRLPVATRTAAAVVEVCVFFFLLLLFIPSYRAARVGERPDLRHAGGLRAAPTAATADDDDRAKSKTITFNQVM